MSKIKNILISLKEKVLKNEFNKNVLILSGGTIIAQALPVLISPILTRLYSPSDFGVLALFISITSIVGVIANGRYELAIMLPEKDEDAINVAAVGFLFNIAISLLFLIFIIIFKKPFLKLLKAESLSFWIYFAPLTVFFIGLFHILNYANNRFKLYKDISKSNILKSIASSLVQLTLGFLKTGTSGLILGQISAQAVANTKLFSNIKKTGLMNEIKKEKIKILYKKYINFPKINLFHALLDNIQSNGIIILLTTFYGSNVIGFYFLSLRILGIPSQFISNSLYQVIYQKAAEIYNKKQKMLEFYKKIILSLGVSSTVIFFIILVLSFNILDFIFGKNWHGIGLYIRSLLGWIFFQFIVSPISSLPLILNKQKELFLVSIIGKIILFTTLIIGYILKLNIINIFYLISLFMSIYFIFCIYWIGYLLKKYNDDILED